MLHPELDAEPVRLEVAPLPAAVVVVRAERDDRPTARLDQRIRLSVPEDVRGEAVRVCPHLELGGRDEVHLAERLLERLRELPIEEGAAPGPDALRALRDRVP